MATAGHNFCVNYRTEVQFEDQQNIFARGLKAQNVNIVASPLLLAKTKPSAETVR